MLEEVDRLIQCKDHVMEFKLVRRLQRMEGTLEISLVSYHEMWM